MKRWGPLALWGAMGWMGSMGSMGLVLPAHAQAPLTEVFDGVGRIVWTPPEGLVVKSSRHGASSPLITCQSRRYECEVKVSWRDLSKPAAERDQAFEAWVRPYLSEAVDKNFRTFRHGLKKDVVYTTLEDARPRQDFRYLTLGYLVRGTASIRFEARTNDPLDYLDVLRMVDSASLPDAREFWALRLGDYKAVCNERFPALKAANEEAFSRSPFATVDVPQFLKRTSPSRSDEEIASELKNARASFATSFDSLPAARRQSFCEGFPKWVEEAGT